MCRFSALGNTDRNTALLSDDDGTLQTAAGKEYAFFQRSSHLVSVAVADSVTSIGDNAFYKCESLSFVAIPGSVKHIGSNAFRCCSTLTILLVATPGYELPGGLPKRCRTTVVEPYLAGLGLAAALCSDAGKAEFLWKPMGFASKADYEESDGLGFTTKGDFDQWKQGLNEWKQDGFTDKAAYDDWVEVLGFVYRDEVRDTKYESAYDREMDQFERTWRSSTYVLPVDYDSDLDELALPDDYDRENHARGDLTSAKNARTKAEDVSLQTVVVPDHVMRIRAYAFQHSPNLVSVTIADSVTSIGNNAFYKCESLSFVAIPGSVNHIGSNAFRCCSTLTILLVATPGYELPGGLPKRCRTTVVEPYLADLGLAAVLCSNISKAEFLWKPMGFASKAEYEKFKGLGNKFDECMGQHAVYTAVKLGGDETFRRDRDWEGMPLYAPNTALQTVAVPNGVQEIKAYAFQFSPNLVSVTIADSVTSTGDYAFYKCESLSFVTIPGSVECIDFNAFDGCSTLTILLVATPGYKLPGRLPLHCSTLTTVVKPFLADLGIAAVLCSDTSKSEFLWKPMGFASKAEYEEFDSLGFTTKNDIDEWKCLGFTVKAHYNECKRLGFTDKAKYDDFRASPEYKECKQFHISSKTDFENFRSSCEYKECKKLGFIVKADFDKCKRLGFTSKVEYDEFKRLGDGEFITKAEYEDCKRLGGFTTKCECDDSKSLGITSKDEYDNFRASPGYDDCKRLGFTTKSKYDNHVLETMEMAQMLYDCALETANAVVDSDTLRYHTLQSTYLQTTVNVKCRDELDAAVEAYASSSSFTNSDGICFKMEGGNLLQPDEKGLMKKAFSTERQAHFAKDIRSALAPVLEKLDVTFQEMVSGVEGVEYHRGKPKQNKRLFQKARLSYKDNIRRITDFERCSFVCVDFQAMVRVFNALIKVVTIVRIKNRFSKKNREATESGGYRDLQMVILLEGGLLLEVQIHLEAFHDLKTQVAENTDGKGQNGHQRYIQFRQLKERAEFTRQEYLSAQLGK